MASKPTRCRRTTASWRLISKGAVTQLNSPHDGGYTFTAPNQGHSHLPPHRQSASRPVAARAYQDREYGSLSWHRGRRRSGYRRANRRLMPTGQRGTLCPPNIGRFIRCLGARRVRSWRYTCRTASEAARQSLTQMRHWRPNFDALKHGHSSGYLAAKSPKNPAAPAVHHRTRFCLGAFLHAGC